MAQLQCQAGRGEVEREYDYIGWCASSLIPEQTANLVVAMRLFECPSVSRREFQQGLSQYVPAPSLSLTFPDARGHVRDVWEELPRSRFRVGPQDCALVIQEDTLVLL